MLAVMSHAIATAAGNRVVGLAKTTSLEVGRMKPATMYQVRSFELFYARIWDNQGRVRTFSLNHLQWKPALHTIEMEKIVRALEVIFCSFVRRRQPIFFSYRCVLDFIGI
jgi:hypothetical protein